MHICKTQTYTCTNPYTYANIHVCYNLSCGITFIVLHRIALQIYMRWYDMVLHNII